eukprot:gene1673-442_t
MHELTSKNAKFIKFIQENVSEETSKIFLENEITEETFLELNEEDLKEMGITKLGPRKKILKIINSTVTNKKRKNNFTDSQPEKKKKIEKIEEKKIEVIQKEEEVIEEPKKIITCCICFEDKDENVTLNCLDKFCTDCLKEYIKTSVQTKKFPVKCPNPKCKQEIQIPIIKKIINDDKLFMEFENTTTQDLIETEKNIYSCCPTPDCKYSFVHLEGDDPHFRCEICRKHYCLNCKSEYHHRMTCLQYKKKHINDVLFIKFVTGANYKQCLKCKAWIERTEGCPHMTCKCGFEFCYACGKSYESCACN